MLGSSSTTRILGLREVPGQISIGSPTARAEKLKKCCPVLFHFPLLLCRRELPRAGGRWPNPGRFPAFVRFVQVAGSPQRSRGGTREGSRGRCQSRRSEYSYFGSHLRNRAAPNGLLLGLWNCAAPT